MEEIKGVETELLNPEVEHEINHYQILVIANPRSGGRRG